MAPSSRPAPQPDAPAAGVVPDPAGTAEAAPRSLADDVRGRSDAELAELLGARPDLGRPRPANLTALAARAATPASLARAVDALDAGALGVLEALVVAAEGAGTAVDEDWAAELLGLDRDDLARAVEPLWRRGLLWRGDGGLHVPRGVPEALSPYVAGLAPDAANRETVAAATRALAGVGDAERAVLDRLAWGPPVGALGARGTGADAAPSSIDATLDSLLARGLLAPRGPGEVLLPRAVALALRGGRLHRTLSLDPPALSGRALPRERVDEAAGAAAADLLGAVEELAQRWGPAPPRVLRSGGLAVADFRATAQDLDLAPDHAAFVVELAYAAGLIDDDGEVEPVWAPTTAYDDWQEAGTGRRWLTLAQAWLATTRAPSLVGRRREAGGSGINALSEAAATALGRAVRHDVLALLASLPPGEAPDETALLARLHWARPRRPGQALTELARAALTQAAWLGMTGDGALCGAGRALVTGASDADVEDALRLPEPVGHVLLQADLTAVAPGRLESRLAGFLRLVADVESRGGATVYRFTPASLRRPLDAGWDAEQLIGALDAASSTGVPQPLDYLVHDVARRHGGLRVGAATAYVRSDDHVAIDDLVGRRDLAAFRLRRLAPGVAVASVAPNVLVGALREAGLLPVIEGPHGATVVPEASAHRAPSRRGAHSRPEPSGHLAGMGHASTRDVVSAMRAGEEELLRLEAERGDLARSPLQPLEPAALAAYLRDAAAGGRPVWIAVVDATGSPRRLRLRPERVEGGRVYGESDAGPGRSYSLHRISAVGPA